MILSLLLDRIFPYFRIQFLTNLRAQVSRLARPKPETSKCALRAVRLRALVRLKPSTVGYLQKQRHIIATNQTVSTTTAAVFTATNRQLPHLIHTDMACSPIAVPVHGPIRSIALMKIGWSDDRHVCASSFAHEVDAPASAHP